jgi:hypothetical protein
VATASAGGSKRGELRQIVDNREPNPVDTRSTSTPIARSRTGTLRELDLGFGWEVAAAVGSVGVWGVWVGPGLVWMGCGVCAAALLCGGRLLAAGHQSSNTVCLCW